MDIIIKTTNRCNLSCAYCYHRYLCKRNHERGTETLTTANVRRILLRTKELSDAFDIRSLNFIWHGGEPTLLPLEFYKRIVRLQDRYLSGITISNNIQTNFCILLEDDYRESLLRNGFSVGFSYDVINHARDPLNKHKSIILRNIFRFQRCGMKLGAIAMVSRCNVQYPRLVFDFFYEHGISFSCNPITAYSQRHRDMAVSVDEYHRFMRELFLCWKEKRFGRIKIGNFGDMARRLKHPDRNSMCTYDENCAYGRINIVVNGDVYPCDNLCGDRSLRYGNIYDRTFRMEHIFSETSKPLRIMIEREKAIQKSCSACAYYRYCYGGCPSSALSRSGSYNDRTAECAYYRKMFAMIRPYVDRIV